MFNFTTLMPVYNWLHRAQKSLDFQSPPQNHYVPRHINNRYINSCDRICVEKQMCVFKDIS
jgi:hypothetical protein